MTKEDAIEILEEVKMFGDSMYQYNKSYMDALDMAIEVLKKQFPMLVTDIHVDEYYCPNCGCENTRDFTENGGDNYCPNCGQRLDWGINEQY